VSGSRVLVALRVAAPPERTFAAFTAEIGQWWRPNSLFRFTDRRDTRLAFEPEPPERLVEIGPDGERFVIGPVLEWEPPRRLSFGWRQASFTDEQSTEVSVRFDPVDTGTRVTVEHVGWGAVPQEHAARHGFPLGPFQQRLAEWWQELLRSLTGHVTD
jgi:uncharacterized protein YndB with AHSA1/START domain